jgi:carbamoyl-phosphate synthase small subunit
VTHAQPFRWDEKDEQSADFKLIRGAGSGEAADARATLPPADIPIVAYDFGMKYNILRRLRQRGFQVQVVPATTTAAQALSYKPAGIFLSNGPGDPAALDYGVNAVRDLVKSGIPIFGICLGHQILGLAFGGKTFKLKFGHRGANQPVLNALSGKVEITAQNHGFAVEEKSLPSCLEITHRNLNDNTVAGLRHKEVPAFSVQYHPESSSGPHDSRYLFRQFREMMQAERAGT